MLDPAEAQAVAAQFGVSPGQIARDHLISHLLAALSAHAADQVIFFGGTALSRSLLPDGRLSEDVDLIARGSRRDVAEHLHDTLPRALRREYPDLRWDPALTYVHDTEPAALHSHSPDGLTVRVQLLSPVGYPTWPVDRVDLAQRRAARGRGWQCGQLADERFMNVSRRIGVPHREHGSPCRPYACSERSNSPLTPSVETYSASKLVPPAASASRITSAAASSTRCASARRSVSVGRA